MDNHKLKIAYLIVAYMDPDQLRHMAERLTKSADVYIHINSSVEITPFENAVKDIEGRVVFSSNRYHVYWGGYSILQATFCMLEDALNYCDYDRVVLLTGLDYPIKPDQYIEDFFKCHAKEEYVLAGVVTGNKYEYLYHYDCRDSRVLHKFFDIITPIRKRLGIKRKDSILLDGKKCNLYGKAPKWALSGECAKYLLDFYKRNKKVNRHFQLMFAPDDYYVSTVLFNSPYKERINNEFNLFKIKWLPDDKGAKILDEEDYAELVECPQLYAKKFQSGYSEELQKMLDKR